MSKSLKRVLAICTCAGIAFFAPAISTKGPHVTIAIRTGLAGAFAAFCAVIWWFEYKRQKDKGEGLTSKPKAKTNFDWGMHYFRAFAILAIMACHYAGGFGYETANRVFFTTSTIYFLFISGYLCQFLDQKRREAPISYYKKKVLNVICPFIIFSLIFAILKGSFSCDFAFVKQLLLGRVQGQYWYIPFVSFLFLASPFICRMKNGKLLTLFSVSAFFFFVFAKRPGVFTVRWPAVFYMYAFFTVWYIMGFVYCRYKSQVDVILNGHWRLFLAGALFLFLIIWAPDWLGLSHVRGGGVTCIQRFLTMCCILVLLGKIRDKRIWFLDQTAKFSFTLYFIHFAVYIQLSGVRDMLLSRMMFLPTVVAEILVFAVYVALMLVLSIIFKTAFGKASRSLLGS